MNRQYSILVTLVCIALVGSIAVQGVLIFDGYEQSKIHLGQALSRALKGTIATLNQEEDLAVIAAFSNKNGQTQVKRTIQTGSARDTSVEINEFVFDTIINRPAKASADASTQARIHVEYKSEVSDSSNGLHFEWFSDSTVDEVIALQRKGNLASLLQKVRVEEWVERGRWQDRVNLDDLVSELRIQLKDENVYLKPEIALVSSSDSIIDGFATTDFELGVSSVSTKMRVFPGDLKQKDVFVTAYLAPSMTHMLSELWITILVAMVFTTLMIALFVVVIQKWMSQARLSQMKTDFINNMSHELKTPLATISLATDALQLPSVAGNNIEVRSLAEKIHAEQKRMLDHVERVLNIAQSSSGGFDLQLRKTSLKTLIENVLDQFQFQLQESAVDLQTELQDATIEVDTLHMESALGNIIDNAIKYSPEFPMIRITSKKEDDLVCVSVHDNGIGLSTEDQTLVFDRFHRVQTGNLQEVKGFGLGLSYTKAVLEAHSGTIDLSSDSTGTTVILKLPCNE